MSVQTWVTLVAASGIISGYISVFAKGWFERRKVAASARLDEATADKTVGEAWQDVIGQMLMNHQGAIAMITEKLAAAEVSLAECKGHRLHDAQIIRAMKARLDEIDAELYRDPSNRTRIDDEETTE